MSVVKITKKVEHHTDQIELAIKIMCLVGDIHLSKTECKVLAFFVVYGIKESTEKMLINGQTVKNLQSLRNIKSKLHGLGFLKRDDDLYKTYELNMSKDFTLESEINMFVKIDRT
jgi:hypothetical protein